MKNPATVKSGGKGLLSLMEQIKSLTDTKLAKYKGRYILIQDEQQLSDYIDASISNGIIAIDTETMGLDPLQDDIVGICIYTPNQKGAYIPITHIDYVTKQKIPNQLSKDIIREYFIKLFEAKPEIIMFNGAFDVRVLRNQVGIHNARCTWDCYIAQRLLNENEKRNRLKPIHSKYVLNGAEDEFTFDDLFKGVKFNIVPLAVAELYGAHDADITYELYEYQHRWLNDTIEREDMRLLYKEFREIEMPCLAVVADMEDNGVVLDLNYQSTLSVKYDKIMNEKLAEIDKLFDNYKREIDAYKRRNPNHKLGDPINVSSPNQLAVFFYDIMKFKSNDKKYPRGTGADILAGFNNDVADAIIEYKEIEKLVSTYIDKLPNCINPNDGKIHCKFNQYGAKTGRFSSKDPNLQNIPSKNHDIRKMFIASDGYVLMSSDYSQQEPKCLSALCKRDGDPQMYETFMQGKDLYAEIASKAFNVPYEECLEHFPKGTPIKKVGNKWYYATEDDYDKLADGETDVYDDGKERRTRAKSILLGALYGRGVASIAYELGCTIEQAKQIKESVFKGFPAIKKFEDDSLNSAREIGYVTTVANRKRRLPELQLDEYEFKYKDGCNPTLDLLDFSETPEDVEVDEITKRKILSRLHNAKSFDERNNIIDAVDNAGIKVTDNTGKIASATRQCVNARIQGSASDLTKLALINLNNNQRLKELGFRLLIPIHDEVIAECPQENAKECADLLAGIMSESAQELLEMPVKCDVVVTKQWYGEEMVV